MSEQVRAMLAVAASIRVWIATTAWTDVTGVSFEQMAHQQNDLQSAAPMREDETCTTTATTTNPSLQTDDPASPCVRMLNLCGVLCLRSPRAWQSLSCLPGG